MTTMFITIRVFHIETTSGLLVVANLETLSEKPRYWRTEVFTSREDEYKQTRLILSPPKLVYLVEIS